MNIIKKISAVFLLTLIVVINIPITLADSIAVFPTDYLSTYTRLYGSSYQEQLSTKPCESRGNMKAVGEAGEQGWWQWLPSTWERYTKKYNEKFGTNDKFDIHSTHDQTKLTAFAYSLGEDAKKEWTTYRAIANGGKYEFTNKQGKHYVIYCKLLVK